MYAAGAPGLRLIEFHILNSLMILSSAASVTKSCGCSNCSSPCGNGDERAVDGPEHGLDRQSLERRLGLRRVDLRGRRPRQVGARIEPLDVLLEGERHDRGPERGSTRRVGAAKVVTYQRTRGRGFKFCAARVGMDAVHVVGAGGIGCAVGYALRAAGVPVAFVEANPAQGRGRPARRRPRRRPPAARRRVRSLRRLAAATGCADAALHEVLRQRGRAGEAAAGRRARSRSRTGSTRSCDAFGHAFEGIASFVSECAPDRPHTRITRQGELHLGRSDRIASRAP